MSFSVSANLLLFKPGAYLVPCLDSLLAQTYENLEILIIDNCSGDGTAQKVREYFESKNAAGAAAPRWRLLENEKNTGFAAGTNQGIKESSGDLVLMVNQDIVMAPDCIEKLAESFEDEKVGAVQGKLWRMKIEKGQVEKTRLIDSAGLLIFKNRRIVARGQGETDKGQFDKKQEIFGADGALPMYRRAALEDAKVCLEKCEYFDEDFVAYKEDVDLGWRLRLLGWQAVYEPQAAAWHARTAGEGAVTNYISVAFNRFRLGSRYAKYHSFKNQRLLQIKNETSGLFLKHCFYWVPKEAGAWLYALVFERYTWKSMKDIMSLWPRMMQKRKLIMGRAKVKDSEMEKWFK